MSQSLTISHRPYGLDGPYDTQLDERIPRDPVGGDMVAIGFLTSPGHAANEVILSWTRNGRPQTPIPARPVARTTDTDRWLVELGVIEAGDRVEYWIEAIRGEERVRTERFAFTARRWRRLAGIRAAVQQGQTLLLATLNEDGGAGPTIEIAPDGTANTLRFAISDAVAPTNELTGNTLTLRNDAIALTVDARTGRFSYGAQTEGAQAARFSLRWLEEGDGSLAAVELLGDLANDEALVGFGERFDALDQHGRSHDVVVYEQYKNQGNRTYLPIPFFMSSRGYGLLLRGTGMASYDLGRTAFDRWRKLARVPSGERGLTFTLFAGTPSSMLRSYVELTGKPDMPPSWIFGPWMSSNEWNNQARVEREVALTHQHDIPATVLVIEAWSDETTFYIWNGARYTPVAGSDRLRLADFEFPSDGPWPDPKGMIDALHAAGIRLLLWQIPALKHIDEPHPQHDADRQYALEQGYVLRNEDGQPYRNPAFWFRDAYIPDFTNTAATAWWLNKRAYLLEELGIDGFKTDGGEHLQGRGLRASNGQRGDALVNAFPNLYIGAYYRFAREKRNGDAVTFSRAGHTGVGAFPTHWAGDENSTWEAFRRSIVAGLTAGLSGVAFWGWDIAGFSEALPSAELYVRATAMAAFCPIMQYHSEYTPPGAPSKDRTPWRIQEHTGDERVIPLYRQFARLRMNLLPYILSEAAYSAATGEPMLRALALDTPDDPQAWRIQDQYRFGRDLLVAPVVEEGATTRRLYLPAGQWRSLWEGALEQGGRWIEVDAPLDRIPVYVRAGTLFALNLGPKGVLGENVGNATNSYTNLTFWLYPAADGRSTDSYDWNDAQGQRRRFQIHYAADGSAEIEVPVLGHPCRVAIVGGTAVDVSASDQSQRITVRPAS